MLQGHCGQRCNPELWPHCVDIYPQSTRATLNTPQYVLDVLQQGQKVGQPVILFRASNSDPAEDFTFTNEGPASSFFAAGLVSAALAQHYGCTGTIPIPGGPDPVRRPALWMTCLRDPVLAVRRGQRPVRRRGVHCRSAARA